MDIEQSIDFEYLKLTVALVILLIIVFMITSRFRTYPKQIIQIPSNTGTLIGLSGTLTGGTKAESFAPYASVLSPSTFRSDPSHDLGKQDNPPLGEIY